MQNGATPTPPHNPGPSHMRTRGNRSHTATNILDPNCTRARGCHSHASTQSGPLSHVHKRPQFPRHNPTFGAPTVRMQEGATSTPPHNPGPSHMRTIGNRSQTATQHTGPHVHTCKRVPLPRLHTIRAPLTRAQEATVPTPKPHILGPYCTRARGCHSHASTQSGPLSHAHNRKPLPHRHQHTGPQLHTCKRVPLPRLHTIRAPLTHAQEATVPTPQPHILGPCCTRARGRHSHASTQSGPLSHVHKRPQLPRCSHATTPHSGPLLYAGKRAPLPRLHTIRAPLTCAQEETAPTPPPNILDPNCTRVRGCHSHASTQSGPLSHMHKRPQLPRHNPTFWAPAAHVQEGATPTPPHNPGPSHTRTRGNRSHTASQHTGPQLHTCKRVPLPRLHTIRAPLTRAQEATAPTPQVHILGPYCTHARGCHSHASTQSGLLSHAHKRKPLPHRHQHTGPQLHTWKRVPLPRLHTIQAPLTHAQEATAPTSLPRHNPTFWAPTARVQEGATPTPPHNPGPSHTCTRGRRSHATSPHSGPLLYACKRVPLPRLHTIRAPLTCAQKETAPTLPPNILDPKCTRARGCHSHASTQSGPLSHVHKRPQLPHHNPTFWAPTVRVQEGATPTPPHNPGPSHTCTRGHSSHAAPTPQPHILGPYCTRARGCHSHASTQSGPLSHAHKRKPLPHRHQHTGPQLHTLKRVPLPRLHTIRAPLTRAQEATAPTPQPHILGPYCTHARGCHSHASTQSGSLSHVHKRPQFPRHNPTFWAPAVRGLEDATPTPPHNPGPSHTRTRGNRSHTATQHTGPQLKTCKKAPLPRLHTIRAPLTRAQEATAPTPLPRHKSTFWAPTVRMQEGATPTPPHNPGSSHMRTRGNRSHTATNILDPNCTRARGCHSHASTQSGPLSRAHKRTPVPRCPTLWTIRNIITEMLSHTLLKLSHTLH
ncbi:unnamed protein product [Oreochromis niloticus]|nr:unnamed protein product [Mustela putorius furo]